MSALKNKAFLSLKWMEKYTKTDMIYLAKGGFWLGIGQVAASGSAFLISIAFANLLAPDLYGIYKYVLSINSLLLITTLTGMDSAITQAVARGFDGTLQAGKSEKENWGVLGSLTALIIGLYYFFQGNDTLAISFSIIALFMPFTESLDSYNSLLWGKKLFSVQTKYNIIKKMIILLCLIGTLFLTKNIYLLLLVYFLALTIPSIFFYNKIKKIYQKNNNVDPEAMKYGKHLSLIGLMNVVLSELDKVLVFQHVGAVDLAVYSLASAPNDQIKGLLKNVNSLAMPQFSQRTPQEIKKTIWHKVAILTLATGLIVFGYILIAPSFFNIFFPKYLESIRFSQILSLSLIPVVISGFLYTVLEAQKARSEIYKYNTYSNIVNIIILLPLVYYFGIWGAVISKCGRRVFEFVLSSRLIGKLE